MEALNQRGIEMNQTNCYPNEGVYRRDPRTTNSRLASKQLCRGDGPESDHGLLV